jgi:hypothetical protein
MTAEIGPQAGFTIIGTSCFGPGLVVDMVADVLTPGFFYKWDMGDGTSYEGVTSVSHTYPDYTPRVARLTVMDTTTTSTCIAVQEALVICPLNVTFSDFYGVEKPEGIQLSWVTAREENSNYFAVQRSPDGIHFEDLGRVNSVGESHQLQEYSFLDVDAPVGMNYFRIREVGNDGEIKFSNTIEIVRLRTQDRQLQAIYDVWGRAVSHTEPGGIYFFHYSDGSTDKLFVQ